MSFLPLRDFLSLWIGAASFMVALASLFAAIAAYRVAKTALLQTMIVAERERRDWSQRKWFDLYFKTNQAYDALERFRVMYESSLSEDWNVDAQRATDWNTVMELFREAGAMAVVFPMNDAIDKLFVAVKLTDAQEAISRNRLNQIQDAMEAIRQKALVDPAVLA